MAANLRDEHGKTIQLTDEHGNPVVLIDEHGNPMHLAGVAFTASESEKVTDYTSPTATTTANYTALNLEDPFIFLKIQFH